MREVRKTPLRSRGELFEIAEKLHRRQISDTPDILLLVINYFDRKIRKLERRRERC